MKIAVIAGSPKGETSVTLQYVRYLQQTFVEHQWVVEHVASRIAKLERNPAAFHAVIDEVRSADLVLWAFPLYVLLVPAGYKRFVELIAERGVADAFAGKYAATLSTSIHFHDHCAHDYVWAVSEDLGMRFVAAHSPEMHDLRTDRGRHQLLAFGRAILETARAGLPTPRTFAPLRHQPWTYRPGPAPTSIDAPDLRVAIVHDATAQDGNLEAMVSRLRQSFTGTVDVINLRELNIRGNCLGCLRCANDNRCAWEGRDEFVDTYRERLESADLLVFAGTVVDRHWSSRWRQFFERAFFKTHTPSFVGKQLAFLVSGPLSQLANLRAVLTGYTQWQEANLVGMVSDECGSSNELDALISALARQAVQAAQDDRVQPFDFRGVGGAKIFRDDIYGKLRFVFRADHRYYAAHGYYDFPTRRWGERLKNALWALLFRIPRVRQQFDRRLRGSMARGVRPRTAAGPPRRSPQARTARPPAHSSQTA